MSYKYAFLTTTMMSRSNGPANFAVNLLNHNKLNDDFLFFTSDYKSNKYKNVIEVPIWISNFIFFKMIFRSYDFFLMARKININTLVWNFSVIAFFSVLLIRNKKHVVFVNDSLSVDSKLQLNYRQLRLKFFSFFERFAVRNSELVITNSITLKKKLILKYRLKDKNIKVLYKGLNFGEINTFKTDFHINRNDQIVISFVKSDPFIGGLSLLCESLSNMKYKFKLLVIGPDKSLLKRFDKYNNISMVFTGKLSKVDVFKKISSSDIFCVPCKDESFGQSNIEAMYCKVPTIILPIPSQLELHSNDYCYFTNGIDSKSISKTLNEVIKKDINERKKKSQKANMKIKEKFSIEKSVKSIIKILND